MLDYRIMPAKIIFMLSILGWRVLLPAWVSEEALANDSRSRSMLLTWQENALSVVGLANDNGNTMASKPVEQRDQKEDVMPEMHQPA